jgi:hypothetical protein
MSGYRFELAGPADDADLRDVLARTPMQGSIRLSFRREPSFFDAARIDGQVQQVVAARDMDTNRLVGFGCRSLRRQYVNGQPDTVGYLSALRLLEEHRGIGLVARGFAFFRELHQDGQAAMYLTTIAEGNEKAHRVLMGGRAGLPIYRPAGRYHTVVIPCLPRCRPSRSEPIDTREATRDDVPAVVDFLAKVGPTRQFFPCYEASDFFSDQGAFKGLRPDDLLLAFRGEKLVGTLAGWDQHDFRQTVVEGYGGLLRWLRPLYNGWAALRRLPSLPAPGQPLHYLCGALPVVAGGDPAVFDALIDRLCCRAAGRWPYLLIGLHESDPLLALLRERRATWYTTLLYLVCWDDGELARQALDERVPFLELGSL